MSVKKIAILTSGGDAPGMNSAIRAAVRTALSRNVEVLGVRRGYSGLINGDVFEMDLRSVSDIIHRGGTTLYTARCKEFSQWEGVVKAADKCREMGIEGVIVIGGDGSFRGARDLTAAGIPCVGIPGTIDNDISCSDYTIGFDTAMNTAMEAIDKVRDTSQSHDRCTVVEVMGRHAGYIALEVGIAVGATAILVPEVKPDIDDVVERMIKAQKADKKHFIIIVAEGIGHVNEIAKYLEEKTGIESRATILGHIQRGGSPTVRDRVVAGALGNRAAELLLEGKGNRVVAIKDNKLTDYDITEALEMKKSLDMELFRIAHEISI